MDTKTAKQFINEAINIAISKGCFNLIDVRNIILALDYINQLPEETKKVSEETKQVPEKIK
jgi:hypothetical protein